MDKSESSSGIEKENVYNSNKEEPILASLLDSYSELKAISINASRPSSCPTLHNILTT